MFTIEDKTINVTRGDILYFSLSANDKDDEEAHIFQPGDIIRMSVYGKKDCSNVVMQKDFLVETPTENFIIFLEEKDTKIGEVINKPKDYWYEIVLNPEIKPQTIVGYDEEGAKVFRLYPEGEEIPAEDEEVLPEDIPVIDDELNAYSNRPVRNKAIAKAVVSLSDKLSYAGRERERLEGKIDTAKRSLSDEIDVERERINKLASLKAGSTTGDAELQDIRVAADGNTYTSAGAAVRKQINDIQNQIDRAIKIELSANLFNYLNVKDGYTITSAAGEYYLNADTFASDYIEVFGGKSYGLFIKISDNIVSLSTTIAAVYDRHKNFIQTIKFGYSTTSANDIAIPENARYLVFVVSSQHKDYIKNIMLCEGTGKIPNAILPYSETVVLNDDDYVRSGELEARLVGLERKTLSGYKWAAIGDSITDAKTVGAGEKNYVDYVSESLGLVAENLGVSGTGFVRNSTNGNNNYVSRLSESLSSDCDIVTIFGSFNDPQETELQGKAMKIGYPTDKFEDGTLCGYINRVLDIIFEKNPLCKVIMFSPVSWGSYWNRYTNTDASGKIDRYIGAMEGVAKRRGVYYKNLTDMSNLRPWDSIFCEAYYLTNDTTHPNTYGHKTFIAPIVECTIREIMRIYE